MVVSNKTLAIIDGNWLIHSSLYTGTEIRNTEGKQIAGPIIAINRLIRFIRDHNPTHLLAVFDYGKSKVRSSIHPEGARGYKGTREKKPEELIYQIELFQEVLENSNLFTLKEWRVEADDIAAKAARYYRSLNLNILLWSVDHDWVQNVRPATEDKGYIKQVQSKKREDVIVDYRSATAEFEGIPPEEQTWIHAMAGDSSDNIEGIYRVGPKSAIKLYKEWKGNVQQGLLHSKYKDSYHKVLNNYKMMELTGKFSNIDFRNIDLKMLEVDKIDFEKGQQIDSMRRAVFETFSL